MSIISEQLTTPGTYVFNTAGYVYTRTTVIVSGTVDYDMQVSNGGFWDTYGPGLTATDVTTRDCAYAMTRVKLNSCTPGSYVVFSFCGLKCKD